MITLINRVTILRLSLVVGLILIIVNSYGLFVDIRPNGIDPNYLRFPGQYLLPYEHAIAKTRKDESEVDLEYAKRLTADVSSSLAHIHWDKVEGPVYNQLVPIWENYFLYFMGLFSGIPEYKKYHFADYKKSIARGIGICGDASMVMSSILDENNIPNNIISFPGHVVTVTKDYPKWVFDPDFGVVLPFSLKQITSTPSIIFPFYMEMGYKEDEIQVLADIYVKKHKVWEGVSHFIKKKYYFEKVVYFLKWTFPLILVFFAVLGLISKRELAISNQSLSNN
jgi:hypothetical protein